MANGAEKGKEESSLKSSKANIVTAAGDDNLKEIFHQIRISKKPVS